MNQPDEQVEVLARWLYLQDLLREYPHLNDNTPKSTMLVETDYNVLKDQWQHLAVRLIDSGVVVVIDDDEKLAKHNEAVRELGRPHV